MAGGELWKEMVRLMGVRGNLVLVFLVPICSMYVILTDNYHNFKANRR